MVDITEFFKKVYSKVGIEIIAIIGIILAVQELTGMDLNLDLIIYILVIVAFVDAVIKISLNIYEVIVLRIVAVKKKAAEYTIEELDAETKTTITDQGVEIASTINETLIEKKQESIQKKIEELTAQLEQA